jgi:hypothetical protein
MERPPLLHPPRRSRRPCLDDAALARLGDPTLSKDDWARTVAHLFVCDRCYRRFTARFEGAGAPEPADQPAGHARR